MVKIFCDTDAIVASIVTNHENHAPAWHLRKLVSSGELTGYLSTHSVAEMYAILTRVPFRPRFSAAQVWRVIREDVLSTFKLVPLDQDDYRKTIEYGSEEQLVGRRVYDALHLAAARKADCDIIYTFNVRHLRELAPDLASRIRAPQLP